MGNPRSVNALRRWCISIAPDIVFLSETKVNKSVTENLKARLGFSNSFGVSSVGRSRGLCLFWYEENISFSLVSFSNNHIAGEVEHKELGKWLLLESTVGQTRLLKLKLGLWFDLFSRM